jgi:hypothetical protein
MATMSYEDIIEDLEDHFEITIKIFLLSDFGWDDQNEFPGHTTPATRKIGFKDVAKKMREDYTEDSTAAEVRILALDDENEIIGAMSGSLNKPNKPAGNTNYGTVSNTHPCT